MQPYSCVPLKDIMIPAKRFRRPENIEALAQAIREAGHTLINPVTLRRAEERLFLVAGMRRLKAVESLGWSEIPALILDLKEAEALLLEIDENLHRQDLTALERACHLAERKNIWLALHPETKRGGAKPKRDPQSGKVMGKEKSEPKTEQNSLLGDAPPAPRTFSEDAAERTGQTARQVNKYTAVGEKLSTKAKELLAGTRAENKLTELQKIANLDSAAEQVKVARKIANGEATSVLQAKRIVKGDQIRMEPQPLPDGPFRVIVADPPWHYEKRENDATQRGALSYPSMTIADIKALAVSNLAAPDAILWLWTTNAHLDEAFAVGRSWGFEYKTTLTWVKHQPGVGDWLRGQTEHCLLTIRGNPTVELRGQSTVIHAPRREHSRKPDEFFALVESLCPGSKVELFAREPREGWQSWGSENLGQQQTEV